MCVRESMSSRFLKIGKLLFTFLRIGKGKSVNLHFKQSLKFIRVFHVICRKTVERERERVGRGDDPVSIFLSYVINSSIAFFT